MAKARRPASSLGMSRPPADLTPPAIIGGTVLRVDSPAPLPAWPSPPVSLLQSLGGRVSLTPWGSSCGKALTTPTVASDTHVLPSAPLWALRPPSSRVPVSGACASALSTTSFPGCQPLPGPCRAHSAQLPALRLPVHSLVSREADTCSEHGLLRAAGDAHSTSCPSPTLTSPPRAPQGSPHVCHLRRPREGVLGMTTDDAP